MAKSKSYLKQVKVNFTPDQHAEIMQIAKEKNMTMAQLLRESVGVIFENPRKRLDPKPKKIEVIVDEDWKFQINKLGTNLNNAIKISYIYKKPIHLIMLQKIMSDMENVDETVRKFVESKKADL